MVPPFVFDFYEGVQNSCFVTTRLLRRPDNLRYFAKKGFPVAGKEATVFAKNEKCLDALDVDESFPAAKEVNIDPMDDSHLKMLHSNTSSTCMDIFEKVQKTHQQWSSVPIGSGVTENQDNKSSKCDDELNTCMSPSKCHAPQNCIRCNEECQVLKNKVEQLEEELADLKKQLAHVSVSRQGAHDGNKKICSAVNAGPTTHSIPPPPPPPPPSSLQFTQNKNLPRKPIKKTRISKERSKQEQLIDMTEVLKGLKDVKLRPVGRSPGGTHLKPKKDPDAGSAVNPLEAAFRKRLAGFHCSDTTKEKDKDDGFDSEWSE